MWLCSVALSIAQTDSVSEIADFRQVTDINTLYEIYVNRPSDFDPGAPDENERYETALALRNRLEELGDETTDYFLIQLRETDRIHSASRIVTFFRQTGMAKDQVLPEIRTLLPHHIEDKTTMLLGALIGYLGEHGTNDDARLLRDLTDHANGSVALVARGALHQLEARLDTEGSTTRRRNTLLYVALAALAVGILVVTLRKARRA